MITAVKEEKSRLNNNKNDNIFNFFLEYERAGRRANRD
jgi:hypothetical protein